jgi:hypothetical protein
VRAALAAGDVRDVSHSAHGIDRVQGRAGPVGLASANRGGVLVSVEAWASGGPSRRRSRRASAPFRFTTITARPSPANGRDVVEPGVGASRPREADSQPRARVRRESSGSPLAGRSSRIPATAAARVVGLQAWACQAFAGDAAVVGVADVLRALGVGLAGMARGRRGLRFVRCLYDHQHPGAQCQACLDDRALPIVDPTLREAMLDRRS